MLTSPESAFTPTEFWIPKIDLPFNCPLPKYQDLTQVDEDGKYSGKKETYCLSGFVRAKGISDQIVTKLSKA